MSIEPVQIDNSSDPSRPGSRITGCLVNIHGAQTPYVIIQGTGGRSYYRAEVGDDGLALRALGTEFTTDANTPFEQLGIPAGTKRVRTTAWGSTAYLK